MSWKCPRCSRINHSSRFRCSCGQRVRSTSSSSSRGDDGLDLIDVMIIADTIYSDDSYDHSNSSSDSSYSSSSSYDSGSSSSDSSSSSD